MSNASKVAIGIVAIIIVLGGGFIVLQKDNSTTTTSTTKKPVAAVQTQTAQPPAAQPSSTSAAATITYTSKGFEPASVTLKSGDKLKITNTSSEDLSFNSDPHPTHTDNPELNVGMVGSGKSATVTLTKKGNWGYHNHLNPSEKGNIVVE